MLSNGIISLLSAIVLAVSISKIRHRMPLVLQLSDKLLIKICWLVVARLIIVSLYHIPVSLGYLSERDYYFQYLFRAYTYADILTSIVGLVFSYYLYTKYYGNERTS
jgi:hypothetical protein